MVRRGAVLGLLREPPLAASGVTAIPAVAGTQTHALSCMLSISLGNLHVVRWVSLSSRMFLDG